MSTHNVNVARFARNVENVILNIMKTLNLVIKRRKLATKSGKTFFSIFLREFCKVEIESDFSKNELKGKGNGKGLKRSLRSPYMYCAMYFSMPTPLLHIQVIHIFEWCYTFQILQMQLNEKWSQQIIKSFLTPILAAKKPARLL